LSSGDASLILYHFPKITFMWMIEHLLACIHAAGVTVDFPYDYITQVHEVVFSDEYRTHCV